MLKDSYIHPLFNGLIVLLLLWLVGLVVFTADIAGLKTGIANVNPNTQKEFEVDGIVVLTGGVGRVQAGLDLLVEGRAPRLMISGVDPRAEPKDLIPKGHAAEKLRSCCITFGTYAEDTIGNAREAAAWANRFHLKSLIVVTSNYHMRRAMVEFKQVLPDTILVPYTITTDNVRLDSWWESSGSAALLLGEYNKYILALFKSALHFLFRG